MTELCVLFCWCVCFRVGNEVQGKTAEWIVTNFGKRMEKFNRIAPENEYVTPSVYSLCQIFL